jgi:hypothetical protein
VGHSAGGHRFKEFSLGQVIEKLVQVTLDRSNGFLENEKHEHWKSQLASAGEILRPEPMTSQEARIEQHGAERFDESDEMVGNVRKNVSHSQCKEQKGKSLYIAKCKIP